MAIIMLAEFRLIFQGAWTALPSLSLSGDIVILLDDGSIVRAHSQYLQHASTVFDNALKCAGNADAQILGLSGGVVGKCHSSETQLPLPSATKQQVLLLLHCLYAWDRKSWAESLRAHELAELARIAHRFDIVPVLQLADESLVKLCHTKGADAYGQLSLMNTLRAPAQFQLAQDLALPQFEHHAGVFIGRHAHDVDIRKLDARSAALLSGARELPRPS